MGISNFHKNIAFHDTIHPNRNIKLFFFFITLFGGLALLFTEYPKQVNSDQSTVACPNLFQETQNFTFSLLALAVILLIDANLKIKSELSTIAFFYCRLFGTILAIYFFIYNSITYQRTCFENNLVLIVLIFYWIQIGVIMILFPICLCVALTKSQPQNDELPLIPNLTEEQ